MQILNRYATLLVNYCLELKEGESLFISTTLLAEPLVKEIYREATRRGVLVEIDFSMSDQARILLDGAPEALLRREPPLYRYAMENFDAYLNIRAPYNLNETSSIDPARRKIRSSALSEINRIYFERTARRGEPGGLKRSLCQFPTQAAAQKANMSLEEYEKFVFEACHLYADNPEAEWLKLRSRQQKIKDYLDKVSHVRFLANHMDISFSVEGRTWINSDGRTNMPSGEVFSAPVEDSVNGKVHFTYPSVYMGQDVSGITLWVENGKIIKWSAEQGEDLLDQVFSIPGADHFGEVAIGTNYQIQRATRNILFDEKIGGTIHMAVGQSYKQCGGLNKADIHWDMISDMKASGKIYADDTLIYEKGQFLL